MRKRLLALLAITLVVSQWYVTRDYVADTFERERLVMRIDEADWASSQNARETAFAERAYDPIGAPGEPRPSGRWSIIQGRGPQK